MDWGITMLAGRVRTRSRQWVSQRRAQIEQLVAQRYGGPITDAHQESQGSAPPSADSRKPLPAPDRPADATVPLDDEHRDQGAGPRPPPRSC